MGSLFYPEEDIRLMKSGQTVFTGALLVADISGFTEITESLTEGGKEGIEELSSLLNRCFDGMLSRIFSRGGSVISFSGDSILARFTETGEASACAEELLSAMGDFRRVIILGKRFSINAKVVVGSGEWNQYIVGSGKRAHILLSGKLVRAVAEREEHALPGELIEFYSPEKAVKVQFATPVIEKHSLVSAGSGRLFGEHRPVTPVFISISGNNDIVEFQKLYLSIEDTVNRHGGYLHHVDGLVPDGVRILALFGAPFSSGNDTLNAVLASIEIADNSRNLESLCLSLGIDTGYAFSGMIGNDQRKHYTVIGDPVNTAARLAGISPAGFVAVTESVAVRTHSMIEYGHSDSIVLKGKSRETKVFFPSGTASSESAAVHMLGREKELADLKKQVADGKGLMVVEGNAGVGKTTLLAEFEKQLRQEGFRIIRTYGGTHNRSNGILSNLVRDICGITGNSTPGEKENLLDSMLNSINDQQLSRRRVFIGRMLLGLNIPDRTFDLLPPKLKKENLLDAVIIILVSLAERTCVIVEDLHSAGEEETEFLLGIVERVNRDAKNTVSFILSTRPEGMKNLQEKCAFHTCHLNGLEDSDSSSLLYELLNRTPLEESIRALLMERADGNPFFLVQFANYLREKELIIIQDGVWRKAHGASLEGLPESIFSMIMARIDTLAEQTRESLKVASVVGMRFSEDVLCRLVNRNVHADLGESLKAGLTFIDSYCELEHIFAHMLIKDVAYDSILGERKRQIHREMGEILEESHDLESLFAVLAYHFTRGEVWEKAADYSIRAAAAAGDQFSNREALQLYGKASDILEKHLPEKHDPLAESLYQSALLLDRVGSFDEAISHYRKSVARSRNDSLTQRALLGIADILFNRGDTKEGIELVEEIERICEQSGDDHREMELKVAAYRAWTYCVDGEIEKAEHEALKAVALGELLEGIPDIDKARAQGHALNTLATVHWAKAEFSRAKELYERAIDIALKNGLKREAAVTWGNIGLVLEKQGECLEAVECIQKQLTTATEIGEKLIVLAAHGDLGMTYSTLGDFENALYHTTKQKELSVSMHVLHDMLLAMNHLASIHLTMGNIDEAELEVNCALDLIRDHSLERERAHSLGIKGRIAAGRNELTEALEYHSEALKIAEDVHASLLMHTIIIHESEVFIKLGDVDRALLLIQRAEEISERTGVQSALGDCLCVRGEMNRATGNAAEAVICYRKAAEIFEKLGSRYRLAESLLSLGLAMRDEGHDTEESALTISRAEELFIQMNLPARVQACML